uniref:Uncharacterized protein n=1 Tax=Candidatus Kentrum sp. TUN TaxID=2126343 RepID=A0A450ZGK7_9GAMM|nr:MAG: hypothetical protein BECKTUN1418E_GA0071001_101040 [Candidatus Kentron sp. TUN]VFK62271.1 MAG: hypothetical protein BECKTUN1418F_GA0071002_12972 [Candidatus Kentron sp. TUN]VFK64794.1 MAG: hypothetical protein BECKTUN1418D_GA0071000_12892 [Candidatus Kentron sp. TUN]
MHRADGDMQCIDLRSRRNSLFEYQLFSKMSNLRINGAGSLAIPSNVWSRLVAASGSPADASTITNSEVKSS